MTQEERNAIALCCGLLEGIADRNDGDYAQQIDLGIKAIKGTLQEEPKKCMYALDDFNDEDRKVTCDGCEEDCKYAKLNTMLDDALTNETKESWNERLDKKDYRERYKRIAQSESFKKTHEGISIGDTVPVEGEISEEPISEEWIEELRTKLDSLSKEDFKKVFDKYAVDFNEERVSEDLNEAAEEWDESLYRSDAFKAGAKWQKANLWKPADGDDLPEYDREVIAILDYDFGHYKVVYAHRPNPNGWNGTNIDTGEKEHFEPEIYDKGGWNQPHVLYWLDARLPYEKNIKED